jgi:predicted nucleic acid-binding protein
MADALFDTTLFVGYLNGDEAAGRLVGSVVWGDASGSYSSITTFEVWLGTRVPEDEVALDSILEHFEAAPLSYAAAKQAAVWLRGTSPRQSEALFRDALIAATAQERGEPLVTRNAKDFQRFGIDVQAY